MKIKDITGITVDAGYYNAYVLSWTTADARYHVWLTKNSFEISEKNVIYKNPPEGVVHRGDGWFATRHLEASNKNNVEIFAHVLTEARKLQLFAAADQKEQAEKDRKDALQRELARISRLHAAGPALYEALKALLDHDYILTTGNRPYLQDNAIAAIAEAEKQ
jgi:hypothetical protein